MTLKYFFIAVTLVSLTSCCKDKPCKTGSIDMIFFKGYSSTELDSIIIRRFLTLNGITSVDSVPLETFNSSRYQKADTTILYIRDSNFVFTPYFRYEIVMPIVNSVQSLRDIREERTEETVCPFSFHSGYCQNPISSYTLNGKISTGDMYIRK